ncbi:MAG: hypothetical protein LBQ11_00730 [Candidatus Nomurabacteria bacterium]|nr:hypothetical protein [Candidatus Nomurabacteria bacterium]
MSELMGVPEENLYNKSLCEMCGGECCKWSPCAYVPSDLGLDPLSSTEEDLRRIMEKNEIIIQVTSGIAFMRPRGKRDRDKDVRRSLTEHALLKNRCVFLGDDGCRLSNNKRPTTGRLYIPKYSAEHNRLDCEPAMNVGYLWYDYQELLLGFARKIREERLASKGIIGRPAYILDTARESVSRLYLRLSIDKTK